MLLLHTEIMELKNHLLKVVDRLPILTERDGHHLMKILNNNCKTNINELYENLLLLLQQI